jgi:mRNA interferase MazF
MPPTTTYKRGDVVLVSFPFTDLTATKQRPALVISPDSVNQFTLDLILAAITSHLTEDERSIVLSETDFLRGKLPKKSVVRLTKIFTIHSILIRKRIGTLTPAKMDEVLDKMRKMFS